jgi:hypothetical protein
MARSRGSTTRCCCSHGDPGGARTRIRSELDGAADPVRVREAVGDLAESQDAMGDAVDVSESVALLRQWLDTHTESAAPKM